MNADKKILFISNLKNPFVVTDMGILKKHYEVDFFQYGKPSDRWKLLKVLPKYDINISWFILGYSYIAVKASKLFSKKSVLMAGGWDVVTLPEINYGYTLDPKKRRRLKSLLTKADMVTSVSNNLKQKILEFEPTCEVTTIHLGLDYDKFHPSGAKRDVVLTVASRIDHETIKLKGLDTFVKSAELLPDFEFFIVGKYDKKNPDFNKLKDASPENVKFTNYVEGDNLIEHYQRARVYAQLSAQEAFGSALAEAMLCGCVPVVTKRGSLPEVVGNTGFFVRYHDLEKTVEAIKNASNSDFGKKARDRIKNNFNLEKRETKVLEIIENL
ncbi:MAG: glycosyltransferase family 4 protein [Thermoplasmata archaeon]|nr:MAG: glycosyltransferase family 4 protein [Thermoplasmata archaeon]